MTDDGTADSLAGVMVPVEEALLRLAERDYRPPEIDPDAAPIVMALLVATTMVAEELQHADETQQRALAELTQSNAELERFAFIASHDLREPIRTMSAYAGMLRAGYADQLDDQAKRWLDYLVSGAGRATALLEGLLEWSRLEKPLSFVPVPLDEVVDGVLRDLGSAIAESGATVTAEPLPVVLGDRVQLSRLFLNLVGNAIKFAGPAPPRIEVTARPSAAADVITVRDQGIGIRPEHITRIFGMFERSG